MLWNDPWAEAGWNSQLGTGAYEFGHWHTQFREGLIPTVAVRGGNDWSGPKNPGRKTSAPVSPHRGREPVEAEPVDPGSSPQPRTASRPPKRTPEPTPAPTGSGGKKKKRRPAPSSGGGPLIVALGRWQHAKIYWP
jgi:hypothetical protein